jgi:hypothetical protein
MEQQAKLLRTVDRQGASRKLQSLLAEVELQPVEVQERVVEFVQELLNSLRWVVGLWAWGEDGGDVLHEPRHPEQLAPQLWRLWSGSDPCSAGALLGPVGCLRESVPLVPCIQLPPPP